MNFQSTDISLDALPNFPEAPCLMIWSVRHVDFGLVRISQPDTISGIPSISGKGYEESTISVEFSKSRLNEDVHN